MPALTEAFLVVEVLSVTSGYRALDLLTREADVQILEASVVGGGRFAILALGVKVALEKAYQSVRDFLEASELTDHVIIDEVEPTLVESIYSLSQVNMSESLLVIECETVSGLLAAAQALIENHALQCIEIKISRSHAGAFGFFTGLQKNCAPAAEDARTHFKSAMRRGRVEVIDQPSTQFRSYFNLSGVP